MRSPYRSLVLSLGLVTSLSGCKQGVGDRCQLSSDCDGYPNTTYCAVPMGNSANGGTCQPLNGGDMATTVDQSVATDSGHPDMTGTDLSMPDLAMPDLLPTPDLSPPTDM